MMMEAERPRPEIEKQKHKKLLEKDNFFAIRSDETKTLRQREKEKQKEKPPIPIEAQVNELSPQELCKNTVKEPSPDHEEALIQKKGPLPFIDAQISQQSNTSVDSGIDDCKEGKEEKANLKPGQQTGDALMDRLSSNSEDSGIVACKDGKEVSEQEKSRMMLENQMSCDVIFRFNQGEEKLGAHKERLSEYSDVFKQMFSGPEATKSEFVVKGISPDVFWEVLRHIYCDNEKIEVLHVVELLYAAEVYNLMKLRTNCLDFLKTCKGISNACYLLVEIHKYQFQAEEDKILNFICKNAEEVLETPGIFLLSRDMLNRIMTMPKLDVDEPVKRKALDRWAKNRQETQKENNTMDNSDPLQDCLYVYRDDSNSHRYILDSVTTQNIFAEPDDSPTSLEPESPVSNGMDLTDGMSTISSNRSRSSVHTYSRLPSCNLWPDLNQVTRLQEVHGVGSNNGTHCDAISFTVDHDIYLYGFSIYGPKKDGEGKYQVDTILTRKKKDIILETINIKGAGVILPVMFERPVKVDRGVPYKLEIYITGPDSHMGASGQSTVQQGQILFTFSNSQKVKDNRSSLSSGQIPRFYFLPRHAKHQTPTRNKSFMDRFK